MITFQFGEKTMEIANVVEKWAGVVQEVTIGATKEEGGTR